MATRIEKIYKKNSLKTFNLILNYINDFVMEEKSVAELCEDIATEIDYFFNCNNITDKDLREAVNGK